MISKPPKNVDELFRDGTPIDAAMREAARDAVRRHKLLGIPVATWQNGQVVIIAPEDIVLDDDGDRPSKP